MDLFASIKEHPETDVVNVYPNPVVDFMHVNLVAQNTGMMQVDIYSTSGLLVLHSTSYVSFGEKVDKVFNLEELTSGVFFLKISINGIPSGTKTILKQ